MLNLPSARVYQTREAPDEEEYVVRRSCDDGLVTTYTGIVGVCIPYMYTIYRV